MLQIFQNTFVYVNFSIFVYVNLWVFIINIIYNQLEKNAEKTELNVIF